MKQPILHSSDILAFHGEFVGVPNWGKANPQRHAEGIWQAVENNHRYNCLLWDEEDLARRKNVSAAEIAANKRAIDGYNQKRNDAIERIDEEILLAFERDGIKPGGPLNSETAGAMIDRLSILTLKVYHMGLQTQRADVDAEHVATCTAKLARLTEQLADLGGCLDVLLDDFAAGRRHYKIYRQFKMYNDPKLNPCLYGAAPAK